MEMLDRFCAESGFNLAENVNKAYGDYKKTERLINKALGILQEQGLYAFAFFCRSLARDTEDNSAGNDKASQILEEEAKKILCKQGLLKNEEDFLKALLSENGIGSKYKELFFAVQILEKAFIYARYRVKALKHSKKEGEQEVVQQGGA